MNRREAIAVIASAFPSIGIACRALATVNGVQEKSLFEYEKFTVRCDNNGCCIVPVLVYGSRDLAMEVTGSVISRVVLGFPKYSAILTSCSWDGADGSPLTGELSFSTEDRRFASIVDSRTLNCSTVRVRPESECSGIRFEPYIPIKGNS